MSDSKKKVVLAVNKLIAKKKITFGGRRHGKTAAMLKDLASIKSEGYVWEAVVDDRMRDRHSWDGSDSYAYIMRKMTEQMAKSIDEMFLGLSPKSNVVALNMRIGYQQLLEKKLRSHNV